MPAFLMSVVIIVDKQRERGERALQSVLQQSNIDNLEVLLFDLAENAAPLNGSDHGAVRCIAMPGAAKTRTFGEVRAEAVHLAQSPIVAFLEEHSGALPGWASATLAGLSELGEEVAGVSGPAVKDFTQTGITDVIRLMNDSDPLPAHGRREVKQLMQNNTSYRRDVLLRYGGRLAVLLNAETLLFAQLIHDGYKLAQFADIKFYHVRELYLSGHGRGNHFSNRIAARYLAKLEQWTAPKILWTVLSAPIRPFLRTANLILYWRKKDPTKTGMVLRNLPKIIAVEYYSVTGQALGLAFGEGKAGVHYLDYALNVPRPTPDVDRMLQSLANE